MAASLAMVPLRLLLAILVIAGLEARGQGALDCGSHLDCLLSSGGGCSEGGYRGFEGVRVGSSRAAKRANKSRRSSSDRGEKRRLIEEGGGSKAVMRCVRWIAVEGTRRRYGGAGHQKKELQVSVKKLGRRGQCHCSLRCSVPELLLRLSLSSKVLLVTQMKVF